LILVTCWLKFSDIGSHTISANNKKKCQMNDKMKNIIVINNMLL
jgi:hypothetical protein